METTKKYIVGLDYGDTIVLNTMEEALELIEKLMTTMIPTDRITVRIIHTKGSVPSSKSSIEHNFLFDEH